MIFMDDARMWHDADDLAQEDESEARMDGFHRRHARGG